MAPPCPDPQLFPPLFPPLPRCRRVARSPLTLLHSSSRLHSSPTPPLERPSLPTTPHTWTAASGHRQPTLPCGFRPSTAAVRYSPVSSSPSCQSLHFLAILSPPRLSDAAGAPSPPMNAAARCRLRRLTVDPPFRCAPALSSLPGTFPVTPSRSPATPYLHRATGKHATAPSRTWSARGDRVDARAAAGRAGRLPRWAGLPGRGPTCVSADCAWQAAAPRGL
jgi:hypothetical protein